MKSHKLKILFVAAHSSELAPLVKLGKKHFVIKKDVAYLAAGVGPVAASFGLTHFLEDFRPEKIIALGTAGIINDKKLKIGQMVQAKSVSTKSLLPQMVTAIKQSHRIQLKVGARFPRPRKKGAVTAPLQKAHVFSPQEITKDDDWRLDLKKAGFDVEHLESFAFAFVAKKFRIPIQIFLGLTNTIGENAHSEWQKNQKKVTQKLCRKAWE